MCSAKTINVSEVESCSDRLEVIFVVQAAGADERQEFVRAETRARKQLHGRRRLGQGKKAGAFKAVIQRLRSDSQQIHAQPRERNASWMSAVLS
jgi:hypothetical protein